MNAAQGVVVGLFCLLAAGAGAAGAQEALASFERTYDIDTPVELDVQTGSGRVVVRGAADGRTRVVGRLHVWPRRGRTSDDVAEFVRRFESEPPVETSGHRIRVGLQWDENDPDVWNRVSISYEIDVPRKARVVVRTGSGNQEIMGVAGPVEASTGSGSIELDNIGNRAEARAGSGTIRATGVAGSFDARTGSGSVSFTQTAPGDVAIATGSGNVELRGVEGALHARTGSGRIEVEGRPTGTWDLEAGSGSIRLELPRDAAFELDAHTASGSLDSNHPVTVQGTLDRGRLRGTVRGGGPLLRARTGSGSVSID